MRAVGAWWDGEPPATCNDGRPLVYAGDPVEEEWASLEQVVTAALDAWENWSIKDEK